MGSALPFAPLRVMEKNIAARDLKRYPYRYPQRKWA